MVLATPARPENPFRGDVLKIRLWMKVTVSVGLLAVIFAVLPWQEVRSAVARLSPGVWFGVLGGFLAGHRLGVAKWRRLINAGRASLSSRDAVRCYAAGLFANLCLPSIIGGDVLRAALASKATGRPEATVLGSVADRIIDVLALSMLLAGGALFASDALPDRGAGLVQATLVVGIVGGLAAALFVLRRPIRRWPRKLRRPVGRSLVALRSLSRDRTTALFAATISFTMQGGFVLLNAWIGRSLGIDVPIAVWFFAWPLAKLAGLLPISLGGLAVRDATLGALLVPVGVPMAVGVVTSLIWQSVLIVGGLLGGLYWWASSRRLGVRLTDAARPVAV
jgi:hypothetical protein